MKRILVYLACCNIRLHLVVNPISIYQSYWMVPILADQVFDVNVVIAPNGMKHFFWVDCANVDGHCYFSHKRTYTGESLSTFVQMIDTELEREPYVPYYRFPDASVAEDGTIYLVWHYRDHDGQYFDCWNYIIPTGGFHEELVISFRMKGSTRPRPVIRRSLPMIM